MHSHFPPPIWRAVENAQSETDDVSELIKGDSKCGNSQHDGVPCTASSPLRGEQTHPHIQDFIGNEQQAKEY